MPADRALVITYVGNKGRTIMSALATQPGQIVLCWCSAALLRYCTMLVKPVCTSVSKVAKSLESTLSNFEHC